MKLWIDAVRPAPEGYFWCKTVKGAKQLIMYNENGIKRYNSFLEENNDIPSWQLEGILESIEKFTIELIDIDHNAGDYIHLLDWLKETGRNYPIHIH